MEVVQEDTALPGMGTMFFTDARALETDACIGGFLAVSKDRKQCPWFSFRVDERMAPWLKNKGNNPKRVIAALELLATLVAVKNVG